MFIYNYAIVQISGQERAETVKRKSALLHLGMVSRWMDKKGKAQGAQVSLTSFLQSSAGEKQAPDCCSMRVPCSPCPCRAPSHGWMCSIAARSQAVIPPGVTAVPCRRHGQQTLLGSGQHPAGLLCSASAAAAIERGVFLFFSDRLLYFSFNHLAP